MHNIVLLNQKFLRKIFDFQKKKQGKTSIAVVPNLWVATPFVGTKFSVGTKNAVFIVFIILLKMPFSIVRGSRLL